jgi:hypothetical protein
LFLRIAVRQTYETPVRGFAKKIVIFRETAHLTNDTKKPTRIATLIGLNFCIMYIDIYTYYSYNKGKRAICAKAPGHGACDPCSASELPALLRMLLIEEPCRCHPMGFFVSVVVGVIIHQFIHNVNDDSVDSENFCDRW